MMPLAIAQYSAWGALGLLFVIAMLFAIGNVVLSSALGPKRKGAIKDAPYESGVDPVGDTRQRFNVRFYLIAMIFLVFDVDVLFLIPWMTIFPKAAFDDVLKLGAYGVSYNALFLSVIAFNVILLVAYVYAWGKGVLKWD